MKYLFAIWILILGGFCLYLVEKGVGPKPITKIRLSQFDNVGDIAAAISQRLHFELEGAPKVIVTGFQSQPWMLHFVETLSRFFPDKQVLFDQQASHWVDKPDAPILLLYVRDIENIPIQPETCEKMSKRQLLDCLSNHMVWRMRQKPHLAPDHRWLAQVEQFSGNDFVLYVRQKKK